MAAKAKNQWIAAALNGIGGPLALVGVYRLVTGGDDPDGWLAFLSILLAGVPGYLYVNRPRRILFATCVKAVSVFASGVIFLATLLVPPLFDEQLIYDMLYGYWEPHPILFLLASLPLLAFSVWTALDGWRLASGADVRQDDDAREE